MSTSAARPINTARRLSLESLPSDKRADVEMRLNAWLPPTDALFTDRSTRPHERLTSWISALCKNTKARLVKNNCDNSSSALGLPTDLEVAIFTKRLAARLRDLADGDAACENGIRASFWGLYDLETSTWCGEENGGGLPPQVSSAAVGTVVGRSGSVDCQGMSSGTDLECSRDTDTEDVL